MKKKIPPSIVGRRYRRALQAILQTELRRCRERPSGGTGTRDKIPPSHGVDGLGGAQRRRYRYPNVERL
jgi:hypothetical protein